MNTPHWLRSCTCRMETVNSASIDPPEMIIDPWCPEHGGKDPDYELEKQREDDAFFSTFERDVNDY